MVTVYLVRHGVSVLNLKDAGGNVEEECDKKYIHFDPPLCNLGVQRTRSMNLSLPSSTIFMSSMLTRAVETASIMASMHESTSSVSATNGIARNVIMAPYLREYPSESLECIPRPLQDQMSFFKDKGIKVDTQVAEITMMRESSGDIFQFLNWLVGNIDANKLHSQNYVVVSHGAVIGRFLIPHNALQDGIMNNNDCWKILLTKDDKLWTITSIEKM